MKDKMQSRRRESAKLVLCRRFCGFVVTDSFFTVSRDQSHRKSTLLTPVVFHWEAVDEDISVASLLQPENLMRLPDKALRPPARAQHRGRKAKLVRPAHR